MRDPNPWRRFLNPHERAWLEDTERTWLTPPPPRSKWGTWGEQKLNALVEKVPENIKMGLVDGVQAALEQMRQGSTWLVSAEAVRQRLGTGLSLPERDAFCADLIQTNTTGLTLEGAVAGAGGLVGLVADIPILYCCLFRIIQEVSIVYDIPVEPPQERFHVVQVLELGHSFSNRERPALTTQVFQLQDVIRRGASLEELESLLAEGVRSSGPHTQAIVRNLRIARQLALDLLERKLLQGLFILGSAIGAAANYQLARDVGLAARHLYRRRFLQNIALQRLQKP
ncbi:EcsC family protein [bacterium]|nr:EcsC family protein [bacterium]